MVDYRIERAMPRPTDKPFICENCDHICQVVKRTVMRNGVKINYTQVIHVDGVTRLGLETGICDDCKDLK